jgi:hypothetical protein
MSLVQILKSNPLIWLLGLGLIFMLAIPKLMENLDEETLKEVRESQRDMHSNMAVSSFLLDTLWSLDTRLLTFRLIL